ncbi:MAG: hypothetical protein MJE66_09620 [Proteobacteria bacterium]|nr:hypothetical protein [Pseudomonadota bacterium]
MKGELRMSTTTSRWLPLLGLLAGALLLPACAADHRLPGEMVVEETAAEDSAPLGGESLAQRKRQLQRSHADMRHYHTTLRSLRHRRDRNAWILFSGFLDKYMGMHVEPMLRGEWQSTHPELMALDANLRLVKAEVLIQLRDPRRVGQTVEEIERRYQGREGMLVEYPIGDQTTLGEALEHLKERKWRG